MQALFFSPFIEEDSVLNQILHRVGFTVGTVHNLDQAVDACPEQPADFVLITLPGDMGKAKRHLENIRLHTVIPISVISDPTNETSQVGIFESGADLIILPPFGIRPMLAQIKSLMRRSAGIPFFSLPTLSQKDVV